jgi:triacylglycerol lipase
MLPTAATAALQLGQATLRVRGPVRLLGFLRSDVVAGVNIPHGQGQPVLIIPPAAGTDSAAPVLTRWLRRIGYSPQPSLIGWHVDCSDRTLDRLMPQIERVAGAHGQPVNLFGHSRGGLLARAAALSRPDLVARVIAVASPLTEPFAITNITLAAAADLARRRLHSSQELSQLGCLTESCVCSYGLTYRKEWTAEQPPLVSLFTRADAVIRWEACLATYAHNVEVRGTHTGVLMSRNAYRIIADALAGHYDAPGTTWAPAVA